MSNWYEEMAGAMRKRETAINGVERWQEKVIQAELEIAELTKSQPTIATAPPAAVFSATEPRIAADYAGSAE